MSADFLPPPKAGAGPWIMGVLNVTPDSFSDGGQWRGADAVDRALAMLEEGADVIDIGGESTRPGAAPAEAEVEAARILPVIEALRRRTDAAISVDTMKPQVAQRAIAAGATIWNDVSALASPAAMAVAAKARVPVILMHMQGEPRTMQAAPVYGDVVAEVGAFLAARAAACRDSGIRVLAVDPGLGFGKTVAHNLALLRAAPLLQAKAGAPILIGASRKSMIERIEGRPSSPASRLGGSIALALAAAARGAAFVRVHDVRATAQALAVGRAIEATEGNAS